MSRPQRVRLRSGRTEEVEIRLEPGTLLRLTAMRDREEVSANFAVYDDERRSFSFARELAFPGDASGWMREVRFGPLPPAQYNAVAVLPDGARVDKKVRLHGEPEASVVLEFP